MKSRAASSVGSTDPDTAAKRTDEEDARDLIRALRDEVMPLYYGEPDAWTAVMRNTVAFTASFLNTQRMLLEYVNLAYRDRPIAKPHPTFVP